MSVSCLKTPLCLLVKVWMSPIFQEHMGRGNNNKALLAGFGPMVAESEDSDYEEEMNNGIQFVETKSRSGKQEGGVRKVMDKKLISDRF